MRYCFAIVTLLSVSFASSSNEAVAQPFEAGTTVAVNTSIFNFQTIEFERTVLQGTVLDRNEFAAAKYDVAGDVVVEDSERIYIIELADGPRLVREVYLNSDVFPENPVEALHQEISLQRGQEKPLKRNALLDAVAAKHALVIAALDDPSQGANLTVQTVGNSIGVAAEDVGLIVSIGQPSAKTVVYGVGGSEATGWKDDPQAWGTLFNKRSTQVGVGAALIKGHAQNLDGPSTGLVWVTIFAAGMDSPTSTTPEPSTIPVGNWAVHLFAGPDDQSGQIIGNITVIESGEFQLDLSDETQLGRLSVANGIVSMTLDTGEVEQRPISPILAQSGNLLGYLLDNEQNPIKWLQRRKPVPGEIPVGEWDVFVYTGPQDQVGQLVWHISVSAIGEYRLDRDGGPQEGTLAVFDDFLEMEPVGDEVPMESLPISPLLDQNGDLLGYLLGDEQNPMKWLRPYQAVPGEIPVGEWDMFAYAGPQDQVGQIFGHISVSPEGGFHLDSDAGPQDGTLSVADGVVSIVPNAGEPEARFIEPMKDDAGNVIPHYSPSV